MSVIEEIKSRISITDYLERIGISIKHNVCNCPFHNDSNASFRIYPATDSFYCFGCEKGGDIFNLYQEMNACDFREALQSLASMAGVQLENSDRYEIIRTTTNYYQNNLHHAPEAIAYLKGRGFNDEIINSGLVGYSGPRRGLLAYLKEHGQDQAAVEAGLIAEGKHGLYDAIGPESIIYMNGHFAGRKINEKRHENQRGPKQPFWAIRRDSKRLIIVEGQADALSFYQWGYSAMALCGTTANIPHDKLERYNDVYFFPDNDGKGAKADKVAGLTSPLIKIMEPLQYEIEPDHWLDNPGHVPVVKDANDMLQVGIVPAESMFATARPWFDCFIQDSESLPPDERIKQILEHYNRLNDIVKLRYQKDIIKALGITKTEFKEYVKLLEPKPPTLDDDNFILDVRAGSESYRVIKDKMFYLKQDNMGNLKPELLLEANIRIDEIIHREDRTELKIICSNGKPLQPIIIDIESYEKLNWIATNWPNISIVPPRNINADHLRYAIQALSTPKHRKIFEHLGHVTIGNERCYLTGHDILGYNGSDDIETDILMGRIGNNMELYSLPASPNNEAEAWRFSLSLWDKLGTPGVLLWAAAFLAPLMPLLSPTFIIFMYARTNSFKSTIAAIFQSFSGDWHKHGKDAWKFLPGSFKGSTMYSIIKDTYIAKDSLFVIDDYFPRKDSREMREQQNILVSLIRVAGNNSGRGRLKNSTQFVAHSDRPRSLTIMTGEEIPDILEESDLARIVACPMKEWDKTKPETETFIRNLTEIQNNAGMLPHAMSSFIIYLLNNWQQIAGELPEIEAETLRYFNRSRYPRQPEAFSKLMAAVDIALECAVECGAISEIEALDRKNQAIKCLRDLMEEHGHTIKATDPVEQFIEELRNHLDDNWTLAENQIGESTGENTSIDIPYGYFHAGYIDEKFVYIKPNYMKKVMESGNFSVGINTMYKRLHDRGVLDKRDKSTYQERVKHLNKVVRLAHLYRKYIYPEEN